MMSPDTVELLLTNLYGSDPVLWSAVSQHGWEQWAEAAQRHGRQFLFKIHSVYAELFTEFGPFLVQLEQFGPVLLGAVYRSMSLRVLLHQMVAANLKLVRVDPEVYEGIAPFDAGIEIWLNGDNDVHLLHSLIYHGFMCLYCVVTLNNLSGQDPLPGERRGAYVERMIEVERQEHALLSTICGELGSSIPPFAAAQLQYPYICRYGAYRQQ